PIPVEQMVKLVNGHLDAVLSRHKLKQRSRLAGAEKAGGAPPNPEEPPAPLVKIQPPPPPGGGEPAPVAQVKGILDELNLGPPPRTSRAGTKDTRLDLSRMPAFSAKVLDTYKPDYNSLAELRKEAEKYPLRAAVLSAAKALEENAAKFSMRESFSGNSTAQIKVKIKSEQQAPAKAELYLREALDELKAAGKKRDAEPSKRWQAHYDYVLARLLSRL